MSLQVEAPAGLGQEAEETVHNRWDTLDTVLVELMKEGFYPMEAPRSAMPYINFDVFSNFQPDKYALLMAQTHAWEAYTNSRLSIITSGLEQCANEMKDIMACTKTKLRKEYELSGEKKPAEAILNDMVASSPRYRELGVMHQRLNQKKRQLASDSERLNKMYALLSRCLEMPKMEVELKRGR